MLVYNQDMQNWIKLVEKHLGLSLSDLQQFQFQVLEEELLEWNKKVNLTAIKDAQGIQEKHFLTP